MSTVAIAAAVKAAVSGGLKEEMGRRGLDDGEGFDEGVVVAEAEAEAEIGGGEKMVAIVVLIWEKRYPFQRWKFMCFVISIGYIIRTIHGEEQIGGGKSLDALVAASPTNKIVTRI